MTDDLAANIASRPRAACAAAGIAACLWIAASSHAWGADLASTPGADPAALSQAFEAAMQRIRMQQPEPPDSPQLEAYVIHDYLVAARLRRDLGVKPSEQLDKAIDAFLLAHAGEPVARGLRNEWLASLADRRLWDWFLPRSGDGNDPALICDRLQGRLAIGDTQGLLADALVRWSLPQKQPAACDGVFAWLRSQGLPTASLADARTRGALEADNPRLAREFAADVPAEYAAPLLQWAQLLETPKSALGALAIYPQITVEAAALLAGFNRLARNDLASAAALLPLLLGRPDVTASLQAQLLRSVALAAAYDRDPGAIAAFERVPPEAVDGQVQEWRVRAALWSGDYATALRWIEELPASLAQLPRWRYWRARAVAATEGSDAAAPLFGEIAGLRDYYGYLAADRLHRAYNLNFKATPDDTAVQAALAAERGLLRAHALFDCDMADDAVAEWATVLGDAPPALKVQAAHLAAGWGWYAEAIAALAQAGEWDDVRLRYPRPFPAAVAQARALTQLPGDWILAVMRQESLFRKDAVSHADARGLMQMQPATAAAVARRWHLPALQPDSLFDPSIAVTLGAAHLRELLDRYGGHLDLSLAAYNAGPQALARWLPNRPMDAAIWIENIPYGETRGYVQHIVEHIVAFAWTRDAEPPSLATLLPRVEPAPSLGAQPLSSN